MTFGDRETGRTQNYSQWRMCDSAHAGYQRLDQGTLNDPGKDSLSKEIQRCLHDPHGRSFHPAGRLRLLPAQDATRYAPVPLRALLPREIDNMLVRGKALSMDPGCAQLRADGSGRDVRGRDCARRPPYPCRIRRCALPAAISAALPRRC